MTPAEGKRAWPPIIDIESLRAEGEAEARYLRLIEGVCDNALDARSDILCCLSAEEGEWSTGGELKSSVKLYSLLMKRAFRLAENISDESEWLVFAVMSKLAKEQGLAEILPWR